MSKKEKVIKEKNKEIRIGKHHKNFYFRNPKAETNVLFSRTVDTTLMHCLLSKWKIAGIQLFCDLFFSRRMDWIPLKSVSLSTDGSPTHSLLNYFTQTRRKSSPR